MRSLRLDPDLEKKVRLAAAAKGESVSEFFRQAAAERAEEALAGRPSERFADVAGSVRGGGGRARRTGAAFTESVAEDCRSR